MAGLLIGMVAFALLPSFLPEADPRLRWGVLLWYPTMGVVVSLLDLLDSGEILPLALPWWLRGAIAGAWMNMLATLMAYDVMAAFLLSAFGRDGMFSSPYWFVAEGALAGIVIAYLVMRFGGEGREIADD